MAPTWGLWHEGNQAAFVRAGAYSRLIYLILQQLVSDPLDEIE
jgi:hypothetical protein